MRAAKELWCLKSHQCLLLTSRFELETAHGTPLRDYHNKLLNECRQKKAVLLRPPRQDKKGNIAVSVLL